MSGLLCVLRKDLLRTIRSPLGPIVFLLFPIVFALLIGLAFGEHGDGKLAPIRLALVDEDGGLLSRFVSSAFHAGRGAGQVPGNASEAFRRGPSCRERQGLGRCARTEGIQRQPDRGIEDATRADQEPGAIGLSADCRRVRERARPPRNERFPHSRRADAGDPGADQVVDRLAPGSLRLQGLGRHRAQVRGVSRYAFPPAIRLEKEKQDGGKESSAASMPFAIALFVLPGMAAFSLLTLAITGMSELRREEASGTLSRQFTSPIWTLDGDSREGSLDDGSRARMHRDSEPRRGLLGRARDIAGRVRCPLDRLRVGRYGTRDPASGGIRVGTRRSGVRKHCRHDDVDAAAGASSRCSRFQGSLALSRRSR